MYSQKMSKGVNKSSEVNQATPIGELSNETEKPFELVIRNINSTLDEMSRHAAYLANKSNQITGTDPDPLSSPEQYDPHSLLAALYQIGGKCEIVLDSLQKTYIDLDRNL